MTSTELRNMMWLYPWDAIDEGISQVLDTIETRAGIRDVALAVAYHSGQFLLPHNPRRKRKPATGEQIAHRNDARHREDRSKDQHRGLH